MDFSTLSYNGKTFNQRVSDNYVNVGQLCATHDKRFQNWHSTASGKEYVEALSSDTGISVSDLVVVSKGGSGEQGTWAHPLVAIEIARWINPYFGVWANKHIKTLIETGKTELQSIQGLERQFLPKPPLKDIRESYKLFKMAYGKAYGDRWLWQIYGMHYPELMGGDPSPEEQASLSSKSLLTPTEIAEQIGFVYSTGSPNPQAVNKLLQSLGYQEKISGQWSATDKAIALGLCDRKPVNTNSRTQKDQLLWSVDIVPILQEHTTTDRLV